MAAWSVFPAEPGHIPLLAAIERAAASLFPPGSIPDAMRDDALPLEVLQQGHALGNLWITLPSGSETPVGYALLLFVENHALLAQMDVMPQYGRQGMGTALLKRAAFRARESGRRSLYLTTFTHVPWNAPWYTRCGFHPVPEEALPPFMRHTLAAERAAGLPHRIAMRLPL